MLRDAGNCGLQHVFAQKQAADSVNKHPVIELSLSPQKQDTTFSKNAYYTVNLLSTFTNAQSGTLSYVLTNTTGKKLKTESMHIKIGTTCQASYDFQHPYNTFG